MGICTATAHTDDKADKTAGQTPEAVSRQDEAIGKPLSIPHQRTCDCAPSHINCLTAKEWIKHQLGVWQFYYQARDIRDKSLHPATFPISLAQRVISLFSHQGELVLDPFAGSGTTLAIGI